MILLWRDRYTLHAADTRSLFFLFSSCVGYSVNIRRRDRVGSLEATTSRRFQLSTSLPHSTRRVPKLGKDLGGGIASSLLSPYTQHKPLKEKKEKKTFLFNIREKGKKETNDVRRLCYGWSTKPREILAPVFFVVVVTALFFFSFLILALFAYRFIYCIRPTLFFYFDSKLELEGVKNTISSIRFL